jgi:branched-chain amino acid transport system substrate-binding protein
MQRKILAAVAAFALVCSGAAFAQKEFKLGVVYDLTGPLAGGGSEAGYLGNKIAIDMVNERGGVEGYKIVPIYVDAQSKVEVAISETERLINQDKVDMIMGVFSSAQCVPMASKMEAAKKIFWANVCVASSVLKGKNFQYAFRAQVHTDQYGDVSCHFVADMAKDKFGVEPKQMKVAIIYEDGPYGSGIAGASDEACKKLGIQVMLKEGYSATTPDLSALVTKLRRARADIILHTGYNPDISLFLRQSKEQGLKFKALVGHGAGYGQIDKLAGTFGTDVNYLFDIDPVAGQLLDPKTLKPGVGDLTKELVKRYQAVKGPGEVPPHASMGFNQAWIFFSDVLPRAIKKYGGTNPDAIRKAALDTDIPMGGTIQGYGVKFLPPGNIMAGQNERASMVVMQFVNGRTNVAWPKAIRTVDPVMPFPKGHTFAP